MLGRVVTCVRKCTAHQYLFHVIVYRSCITCLRIELFSTYAQIMLCLMDKSSCFGLENDQCAV